MIRSAAFILPGHQISQPRLLAPARHDRQPFPFRIRKPREIQNLPEVIRRVAESVPQSLRNRFDRVGRSGPT